MTAEQLQKRIAEEEASRNQALISFGVHEGRLEILRQWQVSLQVADAVPNGRHKERVPHADPA